MLLVYHEPGVPGSEVMLEGLVASLQGAGVEASLAPLEHVLRKGCGGERRVVLLMFGRGGHWASLRDACGVEPFIIEPGVTAAAIAGSADGRYVVLLYRRARRRLDLYSRDLARIARGVRAAGKRVLMLEASRANVAEVPRGSVFVPLSMLPGRLVGLARMLAERHRGSWLPAFAEYGLGFLAAWLAGLEED